MSKKRVYKYCTCCQYWEDQTCCGYDGGCGCCSCSEAEAKEWGDMVYGCPEDDIIYCNDKSELPKLLEEFNKRRYGE